MSHHFRRAITAVAFFVAASLLYQTWRHTQPEYGLFDLLKGKQEGFSGAAAPKLTEADVPSMARFSEESMKLAAAVLPSVVSINTKTVTPVPLKDFFGITRDYRYSLTPSIGSGVIVSSDGYVITNFHVIRGAMQIQIGTNDGEKHEAEVIGSDEGADIAVLRIVGGKDFPALSFADSDDVRVGQLVFAVGNPFGLTGTVTQGIISATRKLSANRSLLQTDTVINPGNSGGPMVNIRGEIIGINFALFPGQESIHTWQGVGLTIPSNEAKAAYAAILKEHASHPSGGYLGLRFNKSPVGVDRSVAPSGVGALVENVDPNSPAAKAGFVPGDVIIKMGDESFESPDQLKTLISKTKPGVTVKLTLVRANRLMTVSIPVVRAP
jgi:S1-C subfamily serine protease